MGDSILDVMEQLVPIGRFSRMTRLSIKALRHYDRIGLLEPAEVDPSSGYRYYRLTQTRQAEAIRLLRGIDMSLDDIATLLADGTAPDVVDKLLDRHRERLAESVRVQQRRLTTVQRLITGKEPLVPYDVTTRTIDPITVVSIRRHTDKAGISTAIGESMHTLYATVMGSAAELAGAPTVLYHDVIDEEQSGDLEVALPIAEPAGPITVDGDMVRRVVDGGTVATTMHHGAYDEIGGAYHVLAGWIAEHGHTPSFPARELYLNDPSQVPEGEQLTEVQWPFE
ncbi:MerR family transcriptional regulator [Euzebya rosea]|uniref:MerR family transcriptional regulator n=1 Tax=Euzebya rosea TaxID=2052804 RepID=UPI00196AB105|nr:MerR family transcriptional regulator [Euzebya rosea]